MIHADYDSESSLKDAFQGQDAVISLVGGTAIGDQDKLINGAIAAGVKRFIPSEFGSNTADKRLRDIVPVFEPKFGTVNYLKSKESEISWTSVVTGVFFDWGLKVGFFGFNGSTKTANVIDHGKAIISATNLHQIGVTLVKALENADLTKNQYVYVSGFQTSQQEVLASAEKITGEKWTVNNTSAKDLIEQGRAKFEKGDYSGILALILGSNLAVDQQLGDFSSQGLWNEKLGVPSESFEETVRTALVG